MFFSDKKEFLKKSKFLLSRNVKNLKIFVNTQKLLPQ
jgi:hypothetical protein